MYTSLLKWLSFYRLQCLTLGWSYDLPLSYQGHSGWVWKCLICLCFPRFSASSYWKLDVFLGWYDGQGNFFPSAWISHQILFLDQDLQRGLISLDFRLLSGTIFLLDPQNRNKLSGKYLRYFFWTARCSFSYRPAHHLSFPPESFNPWFYFRKPLSWAYFNLNYSFLRTLSDWNWLPPPKTIQSREWEHAISCLRPSTRTFPKSTKN